MRRPYTVVLVGASVDGRISLGPDRTMFDDLDGPRMTGRDVWREIEDRLYALHDPGADVLGSNSLVREGDKLRHLPPFDGDPGQLHHDYLPEEVVGRRDHRGWMVVVAALRGREGLAPGGGDRYERGIAVSVSPNTVFVNGHLITVDEIKPRATAMAVRGEWIVAVGDDEEIRGLRGRTREKVDLVASW